MDYTELDHLRDKEPIVATIYERLIAELRKFGPVKIEPKKTSIHLLNRFGFAGVYTRKEYINLEVHLTRKLTSKRVSKVEQASTNRYHHTIRLSDVKEVDKGLLTWLHLCVLEGKLNGRTIVRRSPAAFGADRRRLLPAGEHERGVIP